MKINNFYSLCYPRNLFWSHKQEKAHSVFTQITSKHSLHFALSRKTYLLVKGEWGILFPHISDDKYDTCLDSSSILIVYATVRWRKHVLTLIGLKDT